MILPCKRVRHYQRWRASITVCRFQLREIIEAERLLAAVKGAPSVRRMCWNHKGSSSMWTEWTSKRRKALPAPSNPHGRWCGIREVRSSRLPNSPWSCFFGWRNTKPNSTDAWIIDGQYDNCSVTIQLLVISEWISPAFDPRNLIAAWWKINAIPQISLLS